MPLALPRAGGGACPVEASGARLKIEIMKSGKTSMTEGVYGAAGLYTGAGAVARLGHARL